MMSIWREGSTPACVKPPHGSPASQIPPSCRSGLRFDVVVNRKSNRACKYQANRSGVGVEVFPLVCIRLEGSTPGGLSHFCRDNISRFHFFRPVVSMCIATGSWPCCPLEHPPLARVDDSFEPKVVASSANGSSLPVSSIRGWCRSIWRVGGPANSPQ